MKTLVFIFLFVLTAIAAFAQPDPRDSIILESKTVAPGAHPGSATDTAAYVYLKVYITNKDSLGAWALALIERSTSGGAYMTLARPRTLYGVLSVLTSTLPVPAVVTGRYNSISPDSFVFAGISDALDPETMEPPNLARKLFREIKFDSVFNNAGTIEFDTATVSNSQTGFVNTPGGGPINVLVNFVKSVVTVGVKGDFNMAACDLNCDGLPSPADVALELNAVFLAQPLFPC